MPRLPLPAPLIPAPLPARRLAAPALALLLLLAGCATIFDGYTQPITLETEPQGATCTLTREGRVLGTIVTPGSLTVRRGRNDIVATCTRPGSQVVQLTLASQFTAVTVGNIISWELPGVVVDALNGADYRYRGTLLFVMPPAGPDTPAVTQYRNPNIRPPILAEQPGPAPLSP